MPDFVAKTLAETAGTVERAVFAERYAAANGLLQQLSPPIKLLTFLAMLITVAFMSSLSWLAVAYLFTLALAALSRIPIIHFVRRVWIFIPLFTGIIALPALFNLITPGDELWVVCRFSHARHLGPYTLPAHLAVTQQGLETALFLVLRVATSVSLAVLLVMTTRWMHLLKSLSMLKVPEVAILVLAMTYRYIFLLLHLAEGMFLARRSRLIDKTSLREQHRWLSAGIGVLIGKSFRLGHDVHLAMLSRGWSGKPELMERFRMSKLDVLWLLFVVSGITFILLLR